MNKQFFLGPWCIDASAGTAKSKNGEVRRLQGRALETLLVLFNAQGQVVSKEDLLNKVWGERVVTENSINQAISEIRKVLDEDRCDPQYVITVHGQGYRLLNVSDAAHLEGPAHTTKAYWLKGAGIAALLLTTLSMLFVVTQEGEQLATAVSPQGAQIAYFVQRGKVSTLYVAEMNGKRPRPVVDIESPESHALSWSADGNHLVYNATTSDQVFYAINIIHPNGDSALHIKFAKDPSKHSTDSVPPDLNRETADVEHEEWSGDGFFVHRVDLFGETLAILFVDKLITGFSWSDSSLLSAREST